MTCLHGCLRLRADGGRREERKSWRDPESPARLPRRSRLDVSLRNKLARDHTRTDVAFAITLVASRSTGFMVANILFRRSIMVTSTVKATSFSMIPLRSGWSREVGDVRGPITTNVGASSRRGGVCDVPRQPQQKVFVEHVERMP